MSEVKVVGNVANLPTVVFGHRSPMWWGTVAFVVIEGSTLFICAMSYFYVRENFSAWPPEGMLRPSLTAAGAQVALMLLSNIPMAVVDRAARRLALPVVRIGMVVISFLAILMCVLRGLELTALNVRWDSSAYGSVAWATLVTHSTLLLLQTAETLVFTALLFSSNLEQRDIAAASDNALYWYFMTGVWIPLAVIVFLSPYVL
jgi:heme/copper-type cytochrome/quinol oxidase subunit 3